MWRKGNQIPTHRAAQRPLSFDPLALIRDKILRAPVRHHHHRPVLHRHPLSRIVNPINLSAAVFAAVHPARPPLFVSGLCANEATIASFSSNISSIPSAASLITSLRCQQSKNIANFSAP